MMSNSISGIGGNSAMMMQGMRGMKRPDPAQMANDLFSKLDTSGQGYLTKSDLQSALDKVSSSSSSSSTTSSVDEIFKQFDTNGDGKITKQEFSDTLKKVADQLDQQFQNMRMSGGMSGMGGMPPPSGGDDGGLTKDQLTTAASEVKSTDSAASSALTNLAKNFDAADTNQDGKISLQELVAYEQKTSSTSSSSAEASSASSNTDSEKVMMQIMKLMQAYNIGGDQNSSTISVSA
jgi:Ca2+-binding EF-hand superfamily protein